MKRWVSALVVTVVMLGVLGVAPVAVSAQTTGEHIARFDAAIQLEQDGDAEITETIAYDFGPSYRHGITRTIPIRYDDEGKTLYVKFVLHGVTDEAGKDVNVSETIKDGVASLRIGDPKRTITGAHTYRLTYRLSPVVRHGDNRDVFGYNVTGNDTRVPTTVATATVMLPPGVGQQGLSCFTGVAGATLTDCAFTATETGFTVRSNRELFSGEGLSVFADLPVGSFTNYLEPGSPPLQQSVIAELLGIAVGLLLAAIGIVVYLMHRVADWLNRRHQTIVPQYEAPDTLTPAELGYLHDSKGNITEVTATLIDFAVRGFLKIEQTEPKKLLRKAKYRLTRLEDPTGVQPRDAALFHAFFTKGESVMVDDLDKAKMASAVSTFQSKLKGAMMQKGYYRRGKINKWVKRIGSFTILITLISIVLVLQASHVSNVGGNAIALLVGLVILLLALAARRPTTAGIHEWAEVEGFRWFLRATEQDRLKFTDAPKKTPKLFSALLPAAVALGVEKEWAKQFEGIDIAPNTSWYASQYPFTASDLGSGISSFAGTVSSNVVAPSSGGSGGGGGGFSGGGVGGGGTGSW